MFLEIALSLALNAPDSLVNTSTVDYGYEFCTKEVKCNSWNELVAFRESANLAGFGSVSSALEDGSFMLSFVFVGNEKTTKSQLNRLNTVLEKPIEMYVPPARNITSVKADTEKENSNLVESRERTQINVSSTFEKTKVPVSSKPAASSVVQKSSTTSNTALKTMESPASAISSSVNRQASPIKSNQESDDSASGSTPVSAYMGSKNKTQSPPSRLKKEEVGVSESSSVRYAIIFGSFSQKQNALRLRDELEADGISARILSSPKGFRVGLTFDKYPSQELRDFKVSYPKSWLLRNDYEINQ